MWGPGTKGRVRSTHLQTASAAPECGCVRLTVKEKISRGCLTFAFSIQAPPTLQHPSFLPGVNGWHPVKMKAIRWICQSRGEKESSTAPPQHTTSPDCLTLDFLLREENLVVPRLQWALESPGEFIKHRFLGSPSRVSASECLDRGLKQFPRWCCCHGWRPCLENCLENCLEPPRVGATAFIDSCSPPDTLPSHTSVAALLT